MVFSICSAMSAASRFADNNPVTEAYHALQIPMLYINSFEGATQHQEELKAMRSRFEEMGDQESLPLIQLLLVHNANVALKFMMQIQV